MRIRLLPEAERDLEIGADFYESQKAGLGVYFHECLVFDIDTQRLGCWRQPSAMPRWRLRAASLFTAFRQVVQDQAIAGLGAFRHPAAGWLSGA